MTDFAIAGNEESRPTIVVAKICKVTKLQRFRFRDCAVIVSCDAPRQQKSLNPGDVSCFLKFTQRFKPTPSNLQNHGRSYIENAIIVRRETLALFGRTSSGGGCDGECSPCGLEP